MLIYYVYNCAVCLLDMYYTIKRYYIEPNYITHRDSLKIDDEAHVYEYEVCIKEKVHNIKVISDNKKQDEEIYNNIVKNIDNKQKIVNCSIMNGEECVIDLTNVFREFVYHMETDGDSNDNTYNKLEYFFKYIKEKYDIKEFEDCHFVVYMNDDMFSEHRYMIKELYDKMFIEIINVN
jgi:hypothetical protein